MGQLNRFLRITHGEVMQPWNEVKLMLVGQEVVRYSSAISF